MSFSKVFSVNPPSPTGYMSNKDAMGGFGQLYPQGAPPAPHPHHDSDARTNGPLSLLFG
jgi:hypothetical protein